MFIIKMLIAVLVAPVCLLAIIFTLVIAGITLLFSMAVTMFALLVSAAAVCMAYVGGAKINTDQIITIRSDKKE